MRARSGVITGHGRPPRRNLARACAAALGLVAASCAPAAHPPQPPPTARPLPGYDHLVESPDSVDAHGLAGRRIVLDPGHGGFFRGALGVHGLTEAEVNLGVALRLRDLLVAHGATVRLTRESDRDFLTPSDSSLRSDLAERVRIANEFGPDLFLSIHHNADPGGRHDVNETQSYYKLGDEGPSLDVAQDVHRALVRNVGITTNKVVAGNYFVLRNTSAPAILTETSHITDPDVEERLKLPEKQDLEASALFLGLARYFARPIPVVAAFEASDPRSEAVDTVFASGPMLEAWVDGDFDLAELRVDGDVVPCVRVGPSLEWTPSGPLAQGDHRATLAVRLAGVGSARERALAFRIVRPPRRLVVETLPAKLPRGRAMAGVRVRVLDAAGMPCPDSVRVRVAAFGGGVAPAETVVTARQGVAWSYLRASGTGPVELSTRLVASRASSGLGGAKDPPARTTATAPSGRVTVMRGGRAWTGFVRSMPGDEPLARALGTAEPAPAVRWLSRDGFASFDRDSLGTPAVPALAGYRRWASEDAAFVPIAGGALHGRRIVLDPDGGGENAGGQGPGGTRAANLNLDVARALAAFLTAAGADVRLTRAGDLALSDQERVQIGEAFHPDRLLRIAHRAETARASYYYSSAAGRRWAEGVALECTRLGIPAPRLTEDAQYVLQQASCPALHASLARLDDSEAERRLLEPGAVRREAYALYLALIREWSPDALGATDSVEVRDASGAPVPGAIVRIGDALELETGPDGIARFVRTEPGPLEAEARDPRVRARGVLLESNHGLVLTGSSGP